MLDTSSITVSGTASDLHLDRVTVNGRTASLGTGAFQVDSLALAEGDNVLRARAEDLAGNATELERAVVLDTRAPEVTTVGLTDLAGNALADPQILTFTTADSSGAPGAPAINPLPPFYLCANTWSLTGTTAPQALVRAEGGASTAEAQADENGAFSLEIALAPDRLHRLSVTATDLDGQTSPAAAVRSSTTAPRRRCFSPSVRATTFVATFSEPIAESSATGAVTLGTAAGPLAGSVTASGATATFTPSSSPPSEALRFEVGQQVTDLAGNALAYPFSQVFDAAAEESFLSGTVIGDATGRPLAGARAAVTATDGVALAEPLPEQTTSVDGRFLIPVPSGTHDVTFSRPGYTPVFRIVTTSTGVGSEVFAPRLTPASEAQSVDASGDLVSFEDETSLDVPAGALASSSDVTLTAVGEQGLAALLPYGWSPRGAVWLDIEADLSLGAALSFPVESPDGTLMTVAELDLVTLQWRSLGDVAVADGQVTASPHRPVSPPCSTPCRKTWRAACR